MLVSMTMVHCCTMGSRALVLRVGAVHAAWGVSKMVTDAESGVVLAASLGVVNASALAHACAPYLLKVWISCLCLRRWRRQ